MTREARQPPDYVTCQICGRKYRAITARHLRQIHGYQDDHPILGYKSEFGLRYAICPDSRKKISLAKESFWEKRGQHWTRKDVVKEIRRLHRAGRRLRRNTVPVRLYEIGRRLFGTWQAAVESAGLPYEKVSGVRRWSRQRVIQRIQQLAADGVPLHCTLIKQRYPYLHRAAIRLFPLSWAKALQAAGFDPDEHRKPMGHWSDEHARDWVRERVARNQSILARDAPPDLVDFVHKRLGASWTDFVESLGIVYPGIKKRRDWSKKKLLEEMRRWKAEGHRLNYRSIKSEYQALIHQARKFYGSWDRARAAARV
jgi:hypothetical protein